MGQFYIGKHSTDNLNDGYLGSGIRLLNSIKKYGKGNFIREILEYCTEDELNEVEQKYVDPTDLNSYNIAYGGGGCIVLKPNHPEYEKNL